MPRYGNKKMVEKKVVVYTAESPKASDSCRKFEIVLAENMDTSVEVKEAPWNLESYYDCKYHYVTLKPIKSELDAIAIFYIGEYNRQGSFDVQYGFLKIIVYLAKSKEFKEFNLKVAEDII